jgi:hypothetical protein
VIPRPKRSTCYEDYEIESVVRSAHVFRSGHQDKKRKGKKKRKRSNGFVLSHGWSTTQSCTWEQRGESRIQGKKFACKITSRATGCPPASSSLLFGRSRLELSSSRKKRRTYSLTGCEAAR